MGPRAARQYDVTGKINELIQTVSRLAGGRTSIFDDVPLLAVPKDRRQCSVDLQ